VARSRSRLACLPLALVIGLVAAIPASAVRIPGAPACPIFPDSNVWNRRVDRLPLHPSSSRLIRTIGIDRGLHADFGTYSGYGIPYNVVDSTTPRVRVGFDYADESDAGPYPIPARPRIEGGSDRHMLMVDKDACRLYELFGVRRTASGGWRAGSGATWDLASNRLRPAGWTSADAAGLPILPGLTRYNEVAAGAILHALRFTAPRTRTQYLYPARHQAGESNDPSLPPMGLRVRLRNSFDVTGYSPETRVILTALKRYGMILADNGSSWYISGTSDPRWDDDVLHELHQVTGADLQVVDTSTLRNGS
jgi:hypothetical protein